VPFVVSLDATDPYLVVTAAGPAALAELAGVVSFVAEITTRQRIRRALVDLGAVEPQLSFTDHLQFGALAHAHLSHMELIAAAVPPGYVNAPAARAAQLAGLAVETFLTRDEARRYLEQAANGGTFTQRRAG
jgi:hypothetical protein